MSDEINRSVNPTPPVIVPSPSVSGGTSPMEAAAAGLSAALNLGVPLDVSGAYQRYADREAHLGEEIR